MSSLRVLSSLANGWCRRPMSGVPPSHIMCPPQNPASLHFETLKRSNHAETVTSWLSCTFQCRIWMDLDGSGPSETWCLHIQLLNMLVALPIEFLQNVSDLWHTRCIKTGQSQNRKWRVVSNGVWSAEDFWFYALKSDCMSSYSSSIEFVLYTSCLATAGESQTRTQWMQGEVGHIATPTSTSWDLLLSSKQINVSIRCCCSCFHTSGFWLKGAGAAGSSSATELS